VQLRGDKEARYGSIIGFIDQMASDASLPLPERHHPLQLQQPGQRRSEIDGNDHEGKVDAAVPAIFGMNFQAVSVAQKNVGNACKNAEAETIGVWPKR